MKRYGRPAVVTGEVTQSGGEIYPMWKKVVEDLSFGRKAAKKCLVLGVGGGTIIELLMKRYPSFLLTGVELDPVMLKIATKFFVLKNRKDVHLIQKDAISYVRSSKKEHSYDLIVSDLFVGKLNPPLSRRKGFIHHLKRLIAPQGILLFNAHFQNNTDHQVLLGYLRAEFNRVEEIFSYPLNRVIRLCSDEKKSLP